eukprot:625281-Prorocentrum_minimum.AAC.1
MFNRNYFCRLARNPCPVTTALVWSPAVTTSPPITHTAVPTLRRHGPDERVDNLVIRVDPRSLHPRDD